MELTDLIYANDMDDFNKMLSEKLVDSNQLIDVYYKLMGIKDGKIVLKVS